MFAVALHVFNDDTDSIWTMLLPGFSFRPRSMSTLSNLLSKSSSSDSDSLLFFFLDFLDFFDFSFFFFTTFSFFFFGFLTFLARLTHGSRRKTCLVITFGEIPRTNRSKLHYK